MRSEIAPENDAERKVLDAFLAGKTREVDVFREGAILRASFLRNLFLDMDNKFDPCLIAISRAWVEGMLDLNFCEIKLPIVFSKCIFSEGISLLNASVPELNLQGCEVRQLALIAPYLKVNTNVHLGNGFKAKDDVDLDGADIGGQIVCNGGCFEKALNAQSSKVGESMLLSGRFIAKGEVVLRNAEIGGQLDCSGGHFEKGLTAQSLKTKAGMLLSGNFKADGEVNLNGVEIGGQLDCSGGHFEKGLTAQSLKTKADMLLSGNFKANGEVILASADIGGQFNCNGGKFIKGLNAQSLKTKENVFLSGNFKVNGEVNLNGAEIGGQLNCSGGHFEKSLIALKSLTASKSLVAQNLRTKGSVFLNDKFKASGEVVLRGAEIGGQLVCNGGRFINGLNAANLKVIEHVFMKPIQVVDRRVHLISADIGQDLELSGISFSGSFYFDNAKVHGVFWNLRDWPAKSSCYADGFRYRRIEFSKSHWEAGRDWLDKVSESEKKRGKDFCPQPYEQLMAVYHHMGHTNWAREVGFELESRRHEEFSKGRSLFWWDTWYSILRTTIGYGYKPFRFGLWAAGLVMSGWLLFSGIYAQAVSQLIPPIFQPACLTKFLSNKWIPLEVEALESENWNEYRKSPWDYPAFQPFIYSLEATFPVLPLGQLDKWRPSNRYLLWVRWGLTSIGSVLLTILALFGVGKLGPSWRNEGDSG